MTKTFTTSTVWCDGPNCEAVFADVVETSEELIRSAAKRAGWFLSDSIDLCPKCKKDAQAVIEAGREVA